MEESLPVLVIVIVGCAILIRVTWLLASVPAVVVRGRNTP